MVQGSCLCGDIAWEAGAFELASYCHCSICRKMAGAAFASFVAASESSFHWLRGGDGARRFESSPGFYRSFCGRCGSKVPGLPSEGRVFMSLGTLDGDPGVRPLGHIFAASKAHWHEITDALPRFDELPPGFELVAVPARPRKSAPAGRIAGSCLCDAAGYELEPPIPILRNCHCSRCRKARGGAHATNAVLPLERFRWTRGEARVRSYKVPEARYFTQAFCELCGSPMPRLDPERGIAIVPAGSIDGDPGVRVSEHIFVDSKAPWHAITDAAMRHPGPPPAALPR